MSEDQKSVSDWAALTFGHRSPRYRALMVLEEAIELATAVGLPPAEIRLYFEKVLTKAQMSDGLASEEAADVLSTLYALASTCGFDVHDALDRKMKFNRTRPQSYYDQKTHAKGVT